MRNSYCRCCLGEFVLFNDTLLLLAAQVLLIVFRLRAVDAANVIDTALGLRNACVVNGVVFRLAMVLCTPALSLPPR